MPAKVAPWLTDTPTVPVESLTINELLDVWAAHRNDILSLMAAEEVMRRLIKQRVEAK